MKIRIALALLVIVLSISLSSCLGERIEYQNAGAGEPVNLRHRIGRDGEVSIRFPDGMLLSSQEYIAFGIAQPGTDILITIEGMVPDSDSNPSEEQTRISRHRFSAPIGIAREQGVLEMLVYHHPDMIIQSATIEAALDGETDESPELTLLSVRRYAESPGLLLDDLRIVLPEDFRYRQEIQSASGGDNDADQPGIAVFQDVFLDELLADFDYLNYVPVLELGYEYAQPESGMPVSFDDAYLAGDRNYPDPAPPLARIDMLPGSLDLSDSHSFELRLRPGRQQVYIYPEMLGEANGLLRFSHDSLYGRMRSLRLLSMPRQSAASSAALSSDNDSWPLPAPLPIDLGQLMEYSQALWRQPRLELFSWNLFPGVLMFDFADYPTQARYLKRLAFYVEKQGFRGTLLTNAQLSGRHGWNAHNYRPVDLARFFNQAARENFTLNPEEIHLREILEDNGLLTLSSGEYRPGPGAIISVTSHPLQTRASRRLFLNHEGLHGLFYNDEILQEMSEDLWASFPDDIRRYMEFYFVYMGYDPVDEYLMINEFQAYMLQQDIINLRWLVQTRMAERIVRRFPSERSFIYANNEESGWRMLESGEILQSHIYQTRGLVAGDLFCLVDRPSQLN